MYGVAVLWASDAWSNPELKLRADYASAHADKVKLLKAFAADPKFGPACPMADRWARAKEFGLTPPADVGRMLGLIASGHMLMLVLYNPSTRFNRGFPFHANTPVTLGIVRAASVRVRAHAVCARWEELTQS